MLLNFREPLSNANKALKECLAGSWERGSGCRVRQLPNVSVVPATSQINPVNFHFSPHFQLSRIKSLPVDIGKKLL